jgi:F-type H+-transporting ATPase subunit epsilon
MIGRLGNGALTLTTGGTTESHYVEGGFIQVLDNVVSILTNRVGAIEDLNKDELEGNLRDALAMPGNSVEKLDQREQVVNAVRAQLRVLNRS